MITCEDRAKYSEEFATLELREGQALFDDFFSHFLPNNGSRIGEGDAGGVFRFKVSSGCVLTEVADMIIGIVCIIILHVNHGSARNFLLPCSMVAER